MPGCWVGGGVAGCHARQATRLVGAADALGGLRVTRPGLLARLLANAALVHAMMAGQRPDEGAGLVLGPDRLPLCRGKGHAQRIPRWCENLNDIGVHSGFWRFGLLV